MSTAEQGGGGLGGAKGIDLEFHASLSSKHWTTKHCSFKCRWKRKILHILTTYVCCNWAPSLQDAAITSVNEWKHSVHFTFQSQNKVCRLQYYVCLFPLFCLNYTKWKQSLTPFSQTLLLSLERSQDLLNYVGFRLFLFSSKIPNCYSLVAHSLVFSLFLYLLCWIKHVASEGFHSGTTVEESKYVSSVSLWAGFAASFGFFVEPSLQLYTWGMSQPCHTHSSSKVTVWCDFQWALPLQLAPASSPRGPSFTPNLGRHCGWNWGAEVKGGGLMSPDTPTPSLWDNEASESKLFSVCTAGPREHHCRADLCPRIHLFSIFFFFSLPSNIQQSTVWEYT